MEAPPLERKLVAILAADIAGYSRLMEGDEEGTLSSLSAFRSITDDLISRHGGRICGTAGDSVLAAFGSALLLSNAQSASKSTSPMQTTPWKKIAACIFASGST